MHFTFCCNRSHIILYPPCRQSSASTMLMIRSDWYRSFRLINLKQTPKSPFRDTSAIGLVHFHQPSIESWTRTTTSALVAGMLKGHRQLCFGTRYDGDRVLAWDRGQSSTSTSEYFPSTLGCNSDPRSACIGSAWRDSNVAACSPRHLRALNTLIVPFKRIV